MASNKVDLLRKLATLYRPAAKETFFSKHVAERREELGLSTDRIDENEEVPEDLAEMMAESPPITVVCRHLYTHEEEIVDEHAREVMRAVVQKHRDMPDEEAIKLVDEKVDPLTLLQGISPESLPKIDREHLAGFRGLWEGVVGYCWLLWPEDPKQYLVEACLYAQGKHEDQVSITDEDVELTDEEQARLEPDGDLDVDQEVLLESLRQEFMEQHKGKLRENALAEAAEERKHLEGLSAEQLKAYIGRNFGVQGAVEAFQEEQTVRRLFHTIRDPDTTVKENVGNGRLEGFGKFFSTVSRHPLLREQKDDSGEEAELDYGDIRVVATAEETKDFWSFLVDLDDRTRMCKTQKDVEVAASSRPFRGGLADAIGGAAVSLGLADALGVAGGRGKGLRRVEPPGSASGDAGNGGAVGTPTDQAHEEVSQGLETVDSVL